MQLFLSNYQLLLFCHSNACDGLNIISILIELNQPSNSQSLTIQTTH